MCSFSLSWYAALWLFRILSCRFLGVVVSCSMVVQEFADSDLLAVLIFTLLSRDRGMPVCRFLGTGRISVLFVLFLGSL